MSALFKREVAVIAMTPNEDQTGKEGYAVKVSSGKAALCTADTDVPIGVVVDGEGTSGKSAVAVCDACTGTVRVKLNGTPGTVALGTYLTIASDGTFKAAVSSKTQCARALESGSAGELIEAVLHRPVAAA
jgi:uncharacterized protein YaiE (UPF0345 family)